ERQTAENSGGPGTLFPEIVEARCDRVRYRDMLWIGLPIDKERPVHIAPWGYFGPGQGSVDHERAVSGHEALRQKHRGDGASFHIRSVRAGSNVAPTTAHARFEGGDRLFDAYRVERFDHA